MFSTLQFTSRDQGVLFTESFAQRYYGNAPQTDAEAEAMALDLTTVPASRRTPFRLTLALTSAIRQFAR